MTEPMHIDPNSGAAPQPGGMVVGGAESQRGAAEEERAATQEAYLAEDPTSPQEAELQRQIKVTQNEEEAKQGTPDATDPKEAETPNLAESTAGTPEGEATPSVPPKSSKGK